MRRRYTKFYSIKVENTIYEHSVLIKLDWENNTPLFEHVFEDKVILLDYETISREIYSRKGSKRLRHSNGVKWKGGFDYFISFDINKLAFIIGHTV